MIDRHRRDDCGRIEPPAETNFQQQIIGRMLAEKLEGRRGGDFKEGDRSALVGLFARGQDGKQRIVADEASAAFRAKPDALVKTYQMRRGIDVDALSGRFENGARESDGRAFTIGSSNMNDRRQTLLRRPERGKQPLDPAERQFDRLAMQSEKAGE